MNATRRRLLLWSAPLAVLVIILMLKSISVGMLGDSAGRHFEGGCRRAAHGRIGARGAEHPGAGEGTFLADGDLAVLEGRLDDADERFSAALAGTEAGASCPADQPRAGA